MHRAILSDCLPWLPWWLAACAALVLLTRLGGQGFNWHRLRGVHRCEQGGVQSLALVLTLPAFIMVMLFILQVSQLWIGVTFVHYAAYSAARSSIVWIPAKVGSEEQNQVNEAPSYNGREYSIVIDNTTAPTAWKYHKIWQAAVCACAPIAPSGRLYDPGLTASWSQEMQGLYRAFAPASARNPRIGPRIENKLAYSARHTVVTFKGFDKTGLTGPLSYNPRNSPNPDVEWRSHELGWEDPFSVTVMHRFALLPGPARLLMRPLGNRGGSPDRVSGRIMPILGDTGEWIHALELSATATLTNEGLKSLMPYTQPQ